jgi:N utilization substance protein B
VSDALVTRRAARALALQVLFAIDDGLDVVDPAEAVTIAAAQFELPADADVRALAAGLVGHVASVGRRATIDDAIIAGSRNWRLERMARVDRNILRLAVGEFVHAPGRRCAW